MMRISGKQWFLRFSVPLMAALLWAIPVSLEASILLPDHSPPDLDELLSEADTDVGASSTASVQSDRRSAD